MGEKADARFEYACDVTYTPYKLSLPMEQYLNAALKKDLTIQLKELALDSAKFTKNYVGESNTRLDSNTQEYNYDTAKRNLKTAKTDKEMATTMRICSCNRWKHDYLCTDLSDKGTGRLPRGAD